MGRDTVRGAHAVVLIASMDDIGAFELEQGSRDTRAGDSYTDPTLHNMLTAVTFIDEEAQF